MITTSIMICAAVGISSTDVISESVVRGVPLWDSETVAAEMPEHIRTKGIRDAMGKVARAAAEAEGNSFCHVFEVQVDEYDHSARRLLAVTRTPSSRDQQIQEGFVTAKTALQDGLEASDLNDFQQLYPGRAVDDVRVAAVESAVFHGAMRLEDDSIIVVLGTGVDVLASRWKAADRLLVVAGDVGRWQAEQEILAKASWGLLTSGDWMILADAVSRDQIILYGIGAELAADPANWTAEPRMTACKAVERLAITDDLAESFGERWRGVASNVKQVISNSCLPSLDLSGLKFERPPQPVHFWPVYADEQPPKQDALLLRPLALCLASVYLRQEHARGHAPSAREAIRQGLSDIFEGFDADGMWTLERSDVGEEHGSGGFVLPK